MPIDFYYSTGASIYARVNDSTNKAYDLAAGTGLKANYYNIQDTGITNLSAGIYSVGLFLGVASGQSASDSNIGYVANFDWNGSTENGIYFAKIDLTRDAGNTQDEYTIQWFRNSYPITGNITSPTLNVLNRDGTTLIPTTGLTEIGSTACYKYDTSSNRMSPGDAVLVITNATIDSANRVWRTLLSRDI